jgi:hypothetical protein
MIDGSRDSALPDCVVKATSCASAAFWPLLGKSLGADHLDLPLSEMVVADFPDFFRMRRGYGTHDVKLATKNGAEASINMTQHFPVP